MCRDVKKRRGKRRSCGDTRAARPRRVTVTPTYTRRTTEVNKASPGLTGKATIQAITRPLGQLRAPPPVSEDRLVRWIVQWTRTGHEQLVYDICNSNESPNVIFAGLCHKRADVYTMVLRNCNCKRRYWYDKMSRNRLVPGTPTDDFERAITRRADSLGRSSTSTGYDLASFALNNVATDRRTWNRSSDPLIVVTTDDALSERSVQEQLVYSKYESWRTRTQQTRANPYYWRSRTYCESDPPQPLTIDDTACAVCGALSTIVTRDGSSSPVYTCWRHSLAQLESASAEPTRVCETVLVDAQFLSDETTGNTVCRLRLTNDSSTAFERVNGAIGGGGCLVIGELVTLPRGVKENVLWSESNARDSDVTTGSRTLTTDLETAHALCCSDEHRNEEDMFPCAASLARAGRDTTRQSTIRYDSTVGRVVDLLHCVANTFQR